MNRLIRTSLVHNDSSAEILSQLPGVKEIRQKIFDKYATNIKFTRESDSHCEFDRNNVPLPVFIKYILQNSPEKDGRIEFTMQGTNDSQLTKNEIRSDSDFSTILKN